jgi:hypothetical protein
LLSSIIKRNLLPKQVLLCILLLLINHKALAGALPMPLEAQLDMAKSVLIGKITQIEKSDFNKGFGVQWGRAHVEVEEMLKGVPTEFVEFYIAIGFDDPNYPIKAASPPRIYGVGRSGIWLVGDNDFVMDYYGLLENYKKTEVQNILKMFEERKWSEPVNGLQAWAMVVKPEYHNNQVIIFAVQNISDSNIFIPSELISGTIMATATNDKGKTYDYDLGISTSFYNGKLSKNQIAYLHPNYSFIDLAWRQKLPPGRYSVVIQCYNGRERRPIKAEQVKLEVKMVERKPFLSKVFQKIKNIF